MFKPLIKELTRDEMLEMIQLTKGLMYSVIRKSLQQVAVCQWLACWTDNPAIWVRFPAGGLTDQECDSNISQGTSEQAPMWDMQEGAGRY